MFAALTLLFACGLFVFLALTLISIVIPRIRPRLKRNAILSLVCLLMTVIFAIVYGTTDYQRASLRMNTTQTETHEVDQMSEGSQPIEPKQAQETERPIADQAEDEVPVQTNETPQAVVTQMIQDTEKSLPDQEETNLIVQPNDASQTTETHLAQEPEKTLKKVEFSDIMNTEEGLVSLMTALADVYDANNLDAIADCDDDLIVLVEQVWERKEKDGSVLSEFGDAFTFWWEDSYRYDHMELYNRICKMFDVSLSYGKKKQCHLNAWKEPEETIEMTHEPETEKYIDKEGVTYPIGGLMKFGDIDLTINQMKIESLYTPTSPRNKYIISIDYTETNNGTRQHIVSFYRTGGPAGDFIYEDNPEKPLVVTDSTVTKDNNFGGLAINKKNILAPGETIRKACVFIMGPPKAGTDGWMLKPDSAMTFELSVTIDETEYIANINLNK